jgi:hypothetical protein
MVSHRDLTMYLVAIKSLYSRLDEAQIVVLNDGTLTSHDLDLLNAHIRTPRIVSLSDIQNGSCPRGGAWERLLFISDHVRQTYVIQLDSDTLTLDDVPEVKDAIRDNRSFTLGTSMGRQISPMEEICGQMKAFNDHHVQVVAEQAFDRLRHYARLKYVRGCAAFTGFARGSFSRRDVEEFSAEMEASIGNVWRNWGSEQVTSNFIIANSPGAFVLPHPKYANFAPEIPYHQSSFLHFIGTHRFKSGVYVRKARGVVRRLRAAGEGN